MKYKTYTVHFDNMAWPAVGNPALDLTHTIRYGTNAQVIEARYYISAYIEAYNTLIADRTQKRRNELCKKIVELSELLELDSASTIHSVYGCSFPEEKNSE